VYSPTTHSQELAIEYAINKTEKVFLTHKKTYQNETKIGFLHGWSAGINFGITKFRGDISQYDHYPAFQESVDFYELKTALSFNLEKKITSFYSLSTELSFGEFSGLRRTNEYSSYDIFNSVNYEGNGDKFVTSFSELDLLLNINLTNSISYFVKSNLKTDRKIHLFAKLGMGMNIFNSLRTNLISDTYIYSYGYLDGNDNIEVSEYGTLKKSFFDQTRETVYVYGLKLNYLMNHKLVLNIDYSFRNGLTDKWDASLMSTQYKTDNFSFLSIGFSYRIGNHDFNNDWNTPIDILEDDVSTLTIRIEGFTEDADRDGVADAFDRNPNTPLGVAVDGSGNALDVDMDNIPDYLDSDPFSNIGALVDEYGVELDDDKDGVPNSKDLESNTAFGKMVNKFGVDLGISSLSSSNIIYLPTIYFNSGSALITSSNKNRIATIALLLKKNQNVRLAVIGHTDNVGNKKFNKQLGVRRADAVIKTLVDNYNIDSERLLAKSSGMEDPLVTNSNSILPSLESKTSSIYEINRRVEFEIID
jgi:outer membrane protein OmpA-like peptidoglycan-associated protein